MSILAAAAVLLTVTAGPPRFSDTETAYRAVFDSMDACRQMGNFLIYELAGQQETRDLDRNDLTYWVADGVFRWSCEEIKPPADSDEG